MLMLDADCNLIYETLRTLTDGDDVYKIIEAEEVLGALPEDCTINKQRLSAIIKELKERGYVSVKYFTPDEYCLLTIKRTEDAIVIPKLNVPGEQSAKRESWETPKQKKAISGTALFFAAFFGSMIGSAIVATITALIIKFV